MRKLVILLLCLAGSLFADTTLTDNIANTVGIYTRGSVTSFTVSWPAFTTPTGTPIAAGSKVVTWNALGVFTTTLPSNAGSGSYYTLTFMVIPRGGATALRFSANAVIPDTATPISFSSVTISNASWWGNYVGSTPVGPVDPGTAPPAGYQIIVANGTPLAGRPTLKLVAGSNITLTPSDNGTDTTTVQIAAASVAPSGNATSILAIPVTGTPTDGQTFVYNATSGNLEAIAVPYWRKFTIASSQLTSYSGYTGTITLQARANRQKVCGVSIYVVNGFTAPGIGTIGITVGDTNGTASFYTPSGFSGLDTGQQSFNVLGSPTGASQITATFTSTIAALSSLTAGSADIDVCLINQP